MSYKEIGKLLDAMQKDRANYYKTYERAVNEKEDELILSARLGVLAGIDKMIKLVGEMVKNDDSREN